MNEPTLGATGQFPEGKLTSHDEGELRFAVGIALGQVTIDFGKSVAWIGMSPEIAVKLATSLISHARVVARKQGKPLMVVL